VSRATGARHQPTRGLPSLRASALQQTGHPPICLKVPLRPRRDVQVSLSACPSNEHAPSPWRHRRSLEGACRQRVEAATRLAPTRIGLIAGRPGAAVKHLGCVGGHTPLPCGLRYWTPWRLAPASGRTPRPKVQSRVASGAVRLAAPRFRAKRAGVCRVAERLEAVDEFDSPTATRANLVCCRVPWLSRDSCRSVH
jgi:hypothetical protein